MFFLLLFSTTLLVNGDVEIPACPGTITFNPILNSSYIIYPPKWTGSDPPLFPYNYTCEYRINAPQGWYASVSLSVKTNYRGSNPPVLVTDQLQRTEKIWSVGYEPFYFLANGGTIQLSTGMASVQFGFWLTWKQLPSSPPSHVTVSSQPYLLALNQSDPFQVTADTRVSAVMLQSYNSQNRDFRTIMFFDGPDWNSTCLGTGKQLLDGKTQYVSSGKYLTVIFLNYAQPINSYRVMLQDYDRTKEIVHFQSMQCYYRADCGKFTIDASTGPTAFLTYTDLETIADVVTDIGGTGKLDVYIGGVTEMKANLIASYSPSRNNDYSLPQEFLGKIKTYLLTDGKANITLTRDISYFEDTKNLGRSGFISSNEYGTITLDQDSHTRIFSPNKTSVAKFKYYIQNAALLGAQKMDIVGWHQNSTVFKRHFGRENLPSINLVEEFYGTMLEVTYHANDQQDTGFLMGFTVEKSSSSTCVMTVFGLLFIIDFFRLH